MAGNFRGMVVNSKAKAVFELTVKNGEKLERFGNYLAVAGVAVEIAKSHAKIEDILNSKDSASSKSQKLTALGSMAVFKAVGSPIPLVTHFVANSLEKACGIYNLPSDWKVNIRATDIAVSTTYDQIMDSGNVVHFVNTHLVLPDKYMDPIVNWTQRPLSPNSRAFI